MWRDVSMLLRGEPTRLHDWLENVDGRKIGICLLAIVIGSGIYGVTIGWWRAPLQGLFVAFKFPLLILLTTCGNALLNGILASLFGADISFRQSFLAVLVSFCIASVILGALSPLTFFLVYSCPPMGTAEAEFTHHFVILCDVVVIAFAGVVANAHLYRYILFTTQSVLKSRQVLFSWLAGNILLGGQLSWIMRPFIGTPNAPVEFFRERALDGNFFEAVYEIVMKI